jgi:hypothetical protein
MRYCLAASSAPSSASWPRSCSNPGPSSPYWPKASGFTPPSSLSCRSHRRCSHPERLLVQIHRLLLDLYRGLYLPLLHSGHLRTIVIRVAAVRAHYYFSLDAIFYRIRAAAGIGKRVARVSKKHATTPGPQVAARPCRPGRSRSGVPLCPQPPLEAGASFCGAKARPGRY